MTFGEKLYQLRTERGMSQETLARSLGVSRQAISRWELGSTLPDAPNLLKLSDLFGVAIDYLLRDEYTEKQQSPSISCSRVRLTAKRSLSSASP